MLFKKEYENGQKASGYNNQTSVLTYYFKSGSIKSAGQCINQKLEGEWRFYSETGQLLQVGHFKGGKKQGVWKYYGSDGTLAYERSF